MRIGLVALVVAACGVGLAQRLPLPSADGDTSAGTATTIPMHPVLQRLGADAVITADGVVLGVTHITAGGYQVITPCGNLTAVRRATPLPPVDVVLDPGHGGAADPGAVAGSGLRESEINLEVALATQRELERRGVTTMLTRTGDYPSRLWVRSALADGVGARALVSIHHNAPTPRLSDRPGPEIFAQDGVVESGRLGALIYAGLMDALGGFTGLRWGRSPDAGVLRVLNSSGVDAYGMLRHPETISVLAELAYISNPGEAALMESPEYVEAVSVALADAIERFLTSDDQGEGLVAEPRFFNPRPGIGRDSCLDPPLS